METEKNKPSYYAIIPASVRYDNNLTANAKLMYGEITALSNKEGYCWATNRYFADLYDVKVWSVSHWISELARGNYIRLELSQREDGTTQRKIYLIAPGVIDKKHMDPPVENHTDNTTRYNTTSS